MTFINNISQNYSSNAVGFNNSNGNGVRELKLSFTPEELGVKRGRDGKYPPQARFTENQAEKALFRFFGLNPDNPQDLQRIKARLQTSDSPFAKLKTTNNYPARFNSQTGKYEAVFQIDTKTYAQLRGQIAELKNDPPLGNTSNPLTKPDPNDFYARQQKAKLEAKLPPTHLETQNLTPEQKELLLDLTDLGLSVIGIFEPTPFSDLAGTGLALSRGEYGGAAISALGMIPYLGDLAKLGKLPKLVKVMEAVVSMAKTDGKFAKLVEPLLNGLKNAIDKLPIERLPQKAQDAIKSIKNKIDEFFGKGKIPNGVEPPKPPEIKKTKVGNVELPATTEMSVKDKLYNYLLDPNHPAGGPKAKWFEQALGFTRENMDDLAKQIKFDSAKAIKTGETPHGIKYNQIIEITGANGKKIDVKFAWIKNNDGVVRLVTAPPTKR